MRKLIVSAALSLALTCSIVNFSYRVFVPAEQSTHSVQVVYATPYFVLWPFTMVVAALALLFQQG